MVLRRVLHVTLPEDLATHVVVGGDAPSATSNRCLVIDPSRRRARLSRWDDTQLGSEEEEVFGTSGNGGYAGPASEASLPSPSDLLTYDELIVHPHNAALFEHQVLPVLDQLCDALLEDAGTGPFPLPAPPSRCVFFYGTSRHEAGVESRSRSDLFAETIWRASQYVQSRGDVHATPDDDDGGDDGSSHSPASAPLTAWLSLANLYPRWHVGDVLDAKHLMHRNDRWHGLSSSVGRSRFRLTMKPLSSTLATSKALVALLRAADTPGSLRSASSTIQRDHAQRSAIVCTLTVMRLAAVSEVGEAAATPGGGAERVVSRRAHLHLVLLPDSGATAAVASGSEGQPATATATAQELSGVSAGLSLLAVPSTCTDSRSSAHKQTGEPPLAVVAQRTLRDCAVWRYLFAFAHSTTVYARGGMARAVFEEHSRSPPRTSLSSSSSLSKSQALYLSTVRRVFGPTPMLVLSVLSAWQHYAETRSAFLFAQRASTAPPRWWWSHQAELPLSATPRLLAAAAHETPVDAADSADQVDGSDAPGVRKGEDVVQRRDVGVHTPSLTTPADALSLGTSAGEGDGDAEETFSVSSSKLLPNACEPTPYPYTPAHTASDIVPERQEHEPDSLALVRQKNALIASLQTELDLLRAENSQLRKQCSRAKADPVSRSHGDLASFAGPRVDAPQSVRRFVALARDLFLHKRGVAEQPTPSATSTSAATTGTSAHASVHLDDGGVAEEGDVGLARRCARTHGGLCWRCEASLAARSNRAFHEEFLPLLRGLSATELAAPRTPVAGPSTTTQRHADDAALVSSIMRSTPPPPSSSPGPAENVEALKDALRHLRTLLSDYEETSVLWGSRLGPQIAADLDALAHRQHQHRLRERQFVADHAETLLELDRVLHAVHQGNVSATSRRGTEV